MKRTATEYLQQLDMLRQRFAQEHAAMRDMDKWRYMDVEQVRGDIYEGVAPSDQGEVIVKPEIASTTDTLVSMATSNELNIQIQMYNRLAPAAEDQSNYNERAAKAFMYNIDAERETPILIEVSENAFNRGKIVLGVSWRSMAERGERRRSATSSEIMDPQGPARDSKNRVYEGGRFPLMNRVIDPLQAFYVQDPGSRSLQLIYIESYEHWDGLLAMWPQLESHPKLGKTAESAALTGGSLARVVEYYDTEHYAIIVDGEFVQNPTEHEYLGIVPFVVEVPRMMAKLSPQQTGVREAVPFCKPMIKPVRDLSWALSLLATYMKEIGHVKLIHEGVPSSGDLSPNTAVIEDEGQIVGLASRVNLDMSARSRVLTAYVNQTEDGQVVQERFRYLEPPAMVDHWLAFAQERNADVEVLGFGRAYLSGQLRTELSGYATALRTQLTMTRIDPYLRAIERAMERLLLMNFKIMAAEWAKEERGDVPYFLESMTEEGVPLTPAVVDSVYRVRVKLTAEIPRDAQAENGLILQEAQAGLISTVTAMGLIGKVQDPKDEWQRIVYEGEAMTNPLHRKAIAAAFARRHQMYSPEWQELVEGEVAMLRQQEAQMLEQQAMMGQMAQAADQGAMPLPPGGGGPPPPNGGAPAGLPPDLMAAMAGAATGGPPPLTGV